MRKIKEKCSKNLIEKKCPFKKCQVFTLFLSVSLVLLSHGSHALAALPAPIWLPGKPVLVGNQVILMWLPVPGAVKYYIYINGKKDTMFSGFYLPLFLLLAALIFRGVAFEFRSKDDNPKWRNFWDWAIFSGSLVAPLLLGVAVANLVHGVNRSTPI